MRLTSDWWGKTIWREWMALDMGWIEAKNRNGTVSARAVAGGLKTALMEYDNQSS